MNGNWPPIVPRRLGRDEPSPDAKLRYLSIWTTAGLDGLRSLRDSEAEGVINVVSGVLDGPSVPSILTAAIVLTWNGNGPSVESVTARHRSLIERARRLDAERRQHSPGPRTPRDPHNDGRGLLAAWLAASMDPPACHG